jgi:hypothetical protein
MSRKRLVFIAVSMAILVGTLAFRPPFVRGIYHDMMFSAVRDNQPSTVRALLWLGADPDGTSDHRHSFRYGGMEFAPYIYSAVSHRDCSVLRMLIDAGADVHCQIADGASPIGSAVHDHNIDAVRLLLTAGSSPHHSPTWSVADQAEKLGYIDLLPVIAPYLSTTP